ncbi:MAG: YbdK family carboxylate-amine ligase, partial [Microvirgula sp.]
MNHLAELLPALPASFNILTTFGALLAAGIIGARLFVRTLRLPILSAWVLTGFILGPAALGLVNQAQLTDLQPLVDIGLALILFQLGRRLDVGWLLRERWLAFTSLAIAIALFAAVAVALGAVGLSVTTSLLIAALTLAVSPATLLLTIRELRAEGVVSERALNQTALIHLLGWLALGVTLAGWQAHSQPLTASLLGLLARSVAALLLGLFTAWLAVRLADWLGKLDGYQPVVLVALVTVTMGICSWLGWPAAVALLVLGSAPRRLDRRAGPAALRQAAVCRPVRPGRSGAGAARPGRGLAAGGGRAGGQAGGTGGNDGAAGPAQRRRLPAGRRHRRHAVAGGRGPADRHRHGRPVQPGAGQPAGGHLAVDTAAVRTAGADRYPPGAARLQGTRGEHAMRLEFTPSTPLTFGIELELQILNRRDYALTRGAADMMRLIERQGPVGDIKPEITEGMIEIASAVHTDANAMLDELKTIRKQLLGAADKLNLALSGGGTHPFSRFAEQRIYPKERYQLVSELYGYLAKQFTVFGQHIHIGCPDGDAACRLTHRLAAVIPHFIALSASSPYWQGSDSAFASSRLNAVNAFPLSGSMPFVLDWSSFNDYFERMAGYGIVRSMKDFYWDVRPKPEYGTVEIRVCDTPLSLERAVELGAYARTLAAAFLADDSTPSADVYLTYSYNRFQACRFGLQGEIIGSDG